MTDNDLVPAGDGPHGWSIYDDRPRTCRVYDGRVFAATALDDATTTLPEELVARNRTELAVQAIEIHAARLDDRDDVPLDPVALLRNRR